MTDFLVLSELAARAKQFFRQRFGRPPCWTVAAPGRVNLIGEHTDYNNGFVLPMAIDRYTVVAAAPAQQDRTGTEQDSGAAPVARVASLALDDEQDIFLTGQSNDNLPTWAKYVRGVLQVFSEQGMQPAPFEAMIDSTVPLGGGLSSSAALEVAVATLVEEITGKPLSATQKALLCQRAEHQGVGMPCGIMDQFSSVFGQENRLMLLDCSDQRLEFVPFEDPEVTVLIINSNVKHELASGQYAERRQQCAEAAEQLQMPSLRDVQPGQLEASRQQLAPVLYQRARHVVGEIERTVQAAAAIRAGNWHEVGDLMYASHNSLRDDYQVSCRELDELVEAAIVLGPSGGVIGSRMTGGGFGGCTVSLVHSQTADVVADEICSRYQQRTGIAATAFASRPARGAHVLEFG